MQYSKEQIEIKIPTTLNEHIDTKRIDEDVNVQGVADPAYIEAEQNTDKIYDNLEKDFADQRKITKEFAKENAQVDIKEQTTFIKRKRKMNESLSNNELHKICSDAEYNIGLLLMELTSSDDNYVSSLIGEIDVTALSKAYDELSALSKHLNQFIGEAVAVGTVEKIGGVPVNKIKSIKIDGEDLYRVVSVDTVNREFEVEDSDKEISNFDFDFVIDGVNDGEMQVMKIFRINKGDRISPDDLLVNQIDKSNSKEVLYSKVYDTLAQGLYKGNQNDPNNDWTGVDIGHRVKRYDHVETTADGNILVRDKTEKGLTSAIEVAEYLGLEYYGPRHVSYTSDEYDWWLTIYIK